VASHACRALAGSAPNRFAAALMSASVAALSLPFEAVWPADAPSGGEPTPASSASSTACCAASSWAGPLSRPLDGPGATGVATSDGLAIGLRAGVEALRVSDLRLLCYLELEAPTFASRDPDHGVVNQWAPSAALGVGVLF